MFAGPRRHPAQHARERGDRRALIAGDRHLDLPRAARRGRARAQALAAEGGRAAGRVAVLDRTAGFFTVLFGAAMSRAVTLAVNWRLAAREMEYIRHHAQARVPVRGRGVPRPCGAE